MNFYSKNGSILIMILVLMTALIAIIHSALRTTSYLILLARDRDKAERALSNAHENSLK